MSDKKECWKVWKASGLYTQGSTIGCPGNVGNHIVLNWTLIGIFDAKEKAVAFIRLSMAGGDLQTVHLQKD